GDLAHGQGPDRIAGDRAAVPHDRDGVGDAEQLVQGVGDVDDADTAGGQSPDHTEEDFDLGIGQDGAGFVQDEDAGVLQQGLGDGDLLLLGDGEMAQGSGRGAAVQAEQVQQFEPARGAGY